MKHLKFLIIIFLNFSAYSQEKKHIVFKTNSLNYVFSKGFNASVEVETKKNHSINTNFEIGNRRNSDLKNKHIEIIVDQRSYFARSKKLIYPAGFFVGPFLKYRYDEKIQFSDFGLIPKSGKSKTNFLGAGLTIGYQKFIFKNLTFEPKIGFGGQICVAAKGISETPKILPDGHFGLSFGIKI
jgi:Protein of unknown function (DUF3575)